MTIGVYNLACTASTGKLQLELPKYYAFISANVPHVLLPNGLFEFDIHDVYYGKTHQLLIKYKIDGMAPAGEEVCLKASYFENEIVGTSQILCQQLPIVLIPTICTFFQEVDVVKIIYSILKR